MSEIPCSIFFVLMVLSSQCPPVASQNRCQPCACGHLNFRMTRVIGGSDAEPHEFPWIAMLMLRGQFSCGGSLINSRYILTAAHCVQHSQNPYEYKIHLLRHHSNPRSERGRFIIRGVRRIIVHESYRPGPTSLGADVALMQLDRDILVSPQSNIIAPICLPQSDFNFNGYIAVVAGWGLASKFGDPEVLQKIRVKINNYPNCHLIQRDRQPRSQMGKICASAAREGTGACYGDSGGPLAVRSQSGHYYIVGIVSYGTDYCKNSAPTVYSRVGHFASWIRQHTQDACPCYPVQR